MSRPSTPWSPSPRPGCGGCFPPIATLAAPSSSAGASRTFSKVPPLFRRMKSWFIQLAGALLVLAFALTVSGFVMVLRSQQSGLAATMATANIRAVSPADGGVDCPDRGRVPPDFPEPADPGSEHQGRAAG